MILPDTIDPDRLEDVTDAELLEQLVASGYDTEAAGYMVDVLRGREEPILD
jgi:hypothetical protein